MSKPQSPHLIKAAGAMGVATLLSRLMGLIREQVFAYLFGAGNMTDAFNVAFRIPNLLRDLFAEGAMSASLVPTFTQARVQEGEARAWRIAGLVFRILFLIVGAIAVLGIIFAPELVNLYASAFKAVPGKFELTVRMTRTLFPFFPLVALAAAYMGILNACGVFFLPAFASALFNLTSIVVGVIFAMVFFRWGGGGIQPIEGMAIGVVAGGLVQAFCQLPLLYKKGYRWEGKSAQDPSWARDPRLRKMLWMMIPGFVGLAATQVNILVNTILASSQGPGAVSWLNYAFRLMQFPIGIFGVSLASATLPRVSYLSACNDIEGVSETMSRSLKTVLAVNLPAACGLAFLGYPIIELIFQYGRFEAADTQATATALAMYALGLAAYSAVKVLVPACYALGNTRLPVISSILSVLITILLNLLMVKPFGFWGLALGTSLAAVFNSVFLLVSVRGLIRVRGGRLPVGSIFKEFLRYSVLAVMMGGLCYLSHSGLQKVFPTAWLSDHLGRSGIPFGRAVKMGIVVLEGVGFMMIVAKIFHLRELDELFNLFTSKLKNKLRWPST